MLFDEVTSALDPELVNEVLQVMQELAAGGSGTMMGVSHPGSRALLRGWHDRGWA